MTLLLLIGIALGIIAIIFVYVKFHYIKHKLYWLFIIFGILFIYLTFMASIFGQDLNLTTSNGLEQAGQLYWSWMGNAFDNVKTLTTNAIKMNWETDSPFS
ncbi:MAG: hypothetical protein U9Q06_04175 [Nanoarchaeota archaeon]|nr:hypothetical protein [Nanoarchaeota archaeon]